MWPRSGKQAIAEPCVTQRWALHTVRKQQCLFTFIFTVFLPQSTAVIPIFRFSKQMATMLELYLRFQVWSDCRRQHVIRHRPITFIGIRQ